MQLLWKVCVCVALAGCDLVFPIDPGTGFGGPGPDGGIGNDASDGDPNADAAVPGFTPSNLEPQDLVAGTQDLVLDGAIINTDALTITGGSITGDRLQSQPSPAPTIWVLRVKTLQINGTVSVVGERALAFVASDSITVAGSITFTGGRACTEVQNGDGAASGGGGGFGAVGGSGARGDMSSKAGSGGGVRGSTNLIPLLTGCAGAPGSSFASGSVSGGKGGGALQLVAGSRIDVTGTVCAPGGGGGIGIADTGSGGGGSGGAILLEAPTVNVAVSATLAANGGGGGGSSGPFGVDGQPGGSSCVATAGGSGGAGDAPAGNGGNGGGGPAGAQAGQSGTVGTTTYAGGGGGSAGRIRVNANDVTLDGSTSPIVSQGILTGG